MFEDLRKCVNLALKHPGRRALDRGGVLLLYAAYKACGWGHHPGQLDREQRLARPATPQVIPQWDDLGEPLPGRPLPRLMKEEKTPLLCEGATGCTAERKPGLEGPFRWCRCWPCSELRARSVEKDAALEDDREREAPGESEDETP